MSGTNCTPECWTPIPCPTCGNELPPKGRAVAAEVNIPTCCDEARQSPSNRHLWSEDEEWPWS